MLLSTPVLGCRRPAGPHILRRSAAADPRTGRGASEEDSCRASTCVGLEASPRCRSNETASARTPRPLTPMPVHRQKPLSAGSSGQCGGKQKCKELLATYLVNMYHLLHSHVGKELDLPQCFHLAGKTHLRPRQPTGQVAPQLLVGRSSVDLPTRPPSSLGQPHAMTQQYG